MARPVTQPRPPGRPLTALRISAGALYPVSGPVVIGGALLADGNGRIAEVGPEAQVSTPEEVESVRFPHAILLPGLVNTHTHLELTGLSGEIGEDNFLAWLLHIRRAKSALTEDAFREAARQGVRDAWRCGTTTVADAGDSGAVVDALTELGGRGVVYHEVFGPHPADADDAYASFVGVVEKLRQRAGTTVRVGVSPHAPYTVSGPLYRRVAEFAVAGGLPMAVHIAESHSEQALITKGKGAFAIALKARHIPRPELARSPVRYLHQLGVLAAQPVVIHVVQTDSDDAKLLADHGCAAALCPRSNVRHGHGVPPVSTLLEAGVRLGAGTDSLASVASLDLLADVRSVCELGGLTAEQGVKIATIGGAKAIDFDSEVGSLEPGKWADCCLLPFEKVSATGEVAAARQILNAGCSDILATYVAGRRVYQAKNAHQPNADRGPVGAE